MSNEVRSLRQVILKQIFQNYKITKNDFSDVKDKEDLDNNMK